MKYQLFSNASCDGASRFSLVNSIPTCCDGNVQQPWRKGVYRMRSVTNGFGCWHSDKEVLDQFYCQFRVVPSQEDSKWQVSTSAERRSLRNPFSCCRDLAASDLWQHLAFGFHVGGSKRRMLQQPCIWRPVGSLQVREDANERERLRPCRPFCGT